MIGHVYFEWTHEKAIHILASYNYRLQYLRELTDYELFELGKLNEIWKGENPFKDTKQTRLEIQQ